MGTEGEGGIDGDGLFDDVAEAATANEATAEGDTTALPESAAVKLGPDREKVPPHMEAEVMGDAVFDAATVVDPGAVKVAATRGEGEA